MGVASGVPQVLGAVMLCIVINDLPAALKLSDPHLFADDLKILLMKNNWLKVQSDLDAADSRVNQNRMILAMDKCFRLTFSCDDCKFFLQGVALNSTKLIKDLGVYLSDNLSWHAHVSAKMKKVNSVFYLLKRNKS